MKKAFIDHLLMGGFLAVVFIFFIATSIDETSARNKFYNLKSLTDTSVNAIGNYYLFEEKNKSEAESISDYILDESKEGLSVKSLMTYTWDEVARPITITAAIDNYKHRNFWYRFFDLKHFTLQTQSIGIIDNGEVSNFVPIVINGCTRTFKEGDTFDYLLKSYDLYDDEDNVGFFGAYDPSGGQSSFAHLKNLVKDVMDGVDSEFDLDESLNVATVDSSEIKNDVKQIAQAFTIASFSDTPMSIVEAQCGSTADDLLIERVFEISMKGVYCGDGCFNPAVNDCQLTDVTGGIFTAMDWDTAVNSCNSEDFFKINFEITKIREREVIIIDN